MAAVMIGIDPHKASHTAVVISAAEEPLGELRVRACAARRSSCWRGRGLAGADLGGRGRRRLGTCWPSSSYPRVSGYWMSSLSSARGFGCWPPAT